MGVLPSVYGRPPAAGAALGQAARPVALHRLPRVHHGLQERERGPGRGDPDLRQVGGRRSVPAGQAGVPGHQVQPVRGRAVRGGMPDPGHVPARGRHRRLRQGHLHRLQGLHGRLPVRRDLHQPRGPFGREVQHVRAPAGRRPGAGLRHRLPHRGDPRRRPERPRRQGYPGDQPGAGCRCAGRRRTPGPASSTRARIRPRWTRWRRAGPTAACSPGPPRALRIRSSSPRGTRAGRCPRRRPCCPTTCRTTRRGAGGSACTPGPNRSRPARSRYRPRWPSPGSCPGGTPPPAGPLRYCPWRSWPSPAACWSPT